MNQPQSAPGRPRLEETLAVEDRIEIVEEPAGVPVVLFLAIAVTALVVAASALVGPVTSPEFFITYALVQAAVFLALIYLADLYEREPITVVGLMVLWGGTVACLFALPGNEFVNQLLPEDIRVVFGPAIAAPLVEETAKGAALLLAFWLSQVAARRLGAHAFEGLSDGLVYGAAVGMGFAFTEDIFYFYGLASQAGLHEGWDLFRSRVDFFGLNMLGHSIFTGLTGAGLGAATVIVRPGRRMLAAVGGFAAAVVVHATHNGLVSAVLTARFGLDTTAAALANRRVPPGLLDHLDSTAAAAQAASELIDFLLVGGFFAAVALWLRHQQRIIADELADEDPDVVPPEEVHFVVHYGARLAAYGRLLLDGKVEEWRLARVVHAEFTGLAFLKWRARTGRADATQIERQRYLSVWAHAALQANRTRPDRGSKELLLLSDEALRSSRYDLAESLLEVRAELVVPNDVTRGQMAIMAGRHLAESAFRYEEAFEQYAKAVAAFDRVLARDPADAAAHMHRAGALFRLGEAQAELARHEEALTNYREAIAAADAALALDPGLAEAHRNRAAAFMRLGEAEAQRSRYEEARSSYRAAIASIKATLVLTPGDARAVNIRGIALLGLGEAEQALALQREAHDSFGQAIADFEDATRLVPDFAYGHVNLGTAWTRIGELQASLGPAGREAEASYRHAVAAYDHALHLAPGYVKAMTGRSGALVRLGRLQVSQGRFDEAAGTAGSALASCDDALALTPDHVRAHAHRAEVFLLTSELEQRHGRHGAAADAAAQAVASYERALSVAPEDAGVRTALAGALLTLGRSLAADGQPDEALECGARARQEADRALAVAAGRDDARRIKQEATSLETNL